jgi:hypothetical protein
MTDTADTSSSAVIGSAASDTTKVTEAPAAEASTDSDADAASDSGAQDTTDAPSSATATVGPASSSDSSAETQTDAPATASTASSKSSTASVDTLNESSSGLSTGDSSSIATALPIIFGALACVGAIVMAVTYKKKRDAKNAGEGGRSSSDCEYTDGANFTPDNRALSTVQEDAPPVAIQVQVAVLGADTSAALSAPAATADFTGTNSSVSTLSSPFGSTRCKARVSSPVPSCYSSSESNTEFPDTYARHEGGSNVVLTFQEVATDSHVAPQVQL